MMSSTTPVQRDGVTGVMLNLLRNIDKSKFHIDFIVINEPEEGICNQIKTEGGKIIYIPRKITRPIQYILMYSKACKGYDIVHVHGNSATMVLEMIAAALAGVKVRIAHSHNTYCVSKIIDKIFRPLFYCLCNTRVACGEEAGEWLFGERSFSIINNGINSEKYLFRENEREIIREEFAFDNNNIIVGNVANFLAAKNHDFLIEVFIELHKIDSRYRLLLLGTGNLMNTIREKVEESHINELVYFVGSVSAVEKYLSAMDLIVMPSLNEGFPLTLIEEQCNGLRCFVSDRITKEVDLSGNIEFLSLDKSAEEWAQNIHSIVKRVYDRQQTSCSAQSAIKSKGYDILQSVKLLENIYSKLV